MLTQLTTTRFWRILAWGGSAVILLLPAVAMQFTTDVQWTAADFLVAGGMLLAVCLALEGLLRVSQDPWYRLAAALSVLTALLLTWANAAVGIIGAETNPQNRVFVLVVLLAMLGSLITGFRPKGMAQTMLLTGVLQALIALVAYVSAWGNIIAISAPFVLLWWSAALLFRLSVPTATPAAENAAHIATADDSTHGR
ncbi:hypothetical protein [Ahniella affigens]|nr:hypothetical protein [Ahniella affigens]